MRRCYHVSLPDLVTAFDGNGCDHLVAAPDSAQETPRPRRIRWFAQDAAPKRNGGIGA